MPTPLRSERPRADVPQDERGGSLRGLMSYAERVWRECERARLMWQQQWEVIAEQRAFLRRLGPPPPAAAEIGAGAVGEARDELEREAAVGD